MSSFIFDYPPVNPYRFPDEDPELAWRDIPPPGPAPAWGEYPDPATATPEEHWGAFQRIWWAALISEVAGGDAAYGGAVVDGFPYFNRVNAGPPEGLPDGDEDDGREAA
jgi:hypothetical protein